MNPFYNLSDRPQTHAQLIQKLRESSRPQGPASHLFTIEKPLIVYKKCRGQRVAVLELPTNIIVVADHRGNEGSVSRKMRASYARVVDIYRWGGSKYGTARDQPQFWMDTSTAYSLHDASFKYTVGSSVEPVLPFSHTAEICAPGIHFFIDLHDALAY
jgi:hypothetical protein